MKDIAERQGTNKGKTPRGKGSGREDNIKKQRKLSSIHVLFRLLLLTHPLLSPLLSSFSFHGEV
jgi:hypothetical protein